MRHRREVATSADIQSTQLRSSRMVLDNSAKLGATTLMTISRISRRELLNSGLIGLGAYGLGSKTNRAFAEGLTTKMTVAAVQMHAVLGDVEANLDTAARWVRKAIREGAKAIVLPEFFTSGLGFHPSIIQAHRPINGKPKELLQSLAKEGSAWIGGSFLAEREGHVYNTFMLALPNGDVFTHDKDFPTGAIEQYLYAGGEDARFVELLKERGVRTKTSEIIPPRATNDQDGVFEIGNTRVGAAMCWELVRKRTDRRLLAAQADIVLACSGWYVPDPVTGAKVFGIREAELRALLRTQIKEVLKAPRRMARMTGASVIHANLVGDSCSFSFPSGDKEICRQFLGESQIVDNDGRVVDSRAGSKGEGLVLGEVSLVRTEPSLEIGEGFWHINQSPSTESWWYDGYGRDYYLAATRAQREVHKEWLDRNPR